MTDPFIGPRYKLIGPRVQVIKIEKGATGIKIHMKMGPVIMVWDVDITNVDLYEFTDWLTLYTEVPIKMERQ